MAAAIFVMAGGHRRFARTPGHGSTPATSNCRLSSHVTARTLGHCPMVRNVRAVAFRELRGPAHQAGALADQPCPEASRPLALISQHRLNRSTADYTRTVINEITQSLIALIRGIIHQCLDAQEPEAGLGETGALENFSENPF